MHAVIKKARPTRLWCTQAKMSSHPVQPCIGKLPGYVSM